MMLGFVLKNERFFNCLSHFYLFPIFYPFMCRAFKSIKYSKSYHKKIAIFFNDVDVTLAPKIKKFLKLLEKKSHVIKTICCD
jgi:hypothetical protein